MWCVLMLELVLMLLCTWASRSEMTQMTPAVTLWWIIVLLTMHTKYLK